MTNTKRRTLLKGTLATALAVGSAASPLAIGGSKNASPTRSPDELGSASWSEIRQHFNLDNDVVHMACFLLASHPKQVSLAIEKYRHQLDRNPAQFLMQAEHELELSVLQAAAQYINEKAENIALTQSTTEGLATLYNGLQIGKDQEVLTTEHDHYATFKSLAFSTQRNGASIKRIALYDEKNPASATADAIVDRLARAITDKTRVIALTWVHSSSGIKLPIHEISKVVAKANEGRDEADRVLLCVDGVHGFGIEDIDIQHMGCDFFIAGTHKWMFGPRGTGILWGKSDAWQYVEPTIPTFDLGAFLQWMKFMPASPIPGAIRMTPGGTHAFEHRWAMNEAFDFHQRIGKARVAKRIHSLNSHLKEEMLKIKGVTLKTPKSATLSSGITAFEIEGLSPANSVQTFRQHRIIASQSPYAITYTRLSPGIINSEEDVEKSLSAVRKIAQT